MALPDVIKGIKNNIKKGRSPKVRKASGRSLGKGIITNQAGAFGKPKRRKSNES